MTFINYPDNYHDSINKFGDREVGITHPDLPSYIRLTNKGTIEITGAPGLSIIMDATTNSITLVADDIKFMTNDKKGLRWNGLSFNSKATTFNEPAFIQVATDEVSSMYAGFEDFLD